MTVYVDVLLPCIRSAKWPYDKSCHLIADTVPGLHAFARSLRLRRAWFQDRPNMPHYDLTAGMRARAVRLGAREIGREKVALIMARNRLKNNRTTDAG